MSFISKYAVKILDWSSKQPQVSLPDDIFYFVSRSTPLINVDLLVKDKNNRVLLSWRDDEYSGTGWHIPGGIIRYKENIKKRVDEVSRLELKGKVIYKASPIAINEIITKKQRDRGHFISLLFNCSINDDYKINNGNLKSDEPGFLKWFQHCPANLISWHEIYREYIESDETSLKINNRMGELYE
jgi:ADP-ribose pyrophosphatase YjhB (NUDIX family)